MHRSIVATWLGHEDHNQTLQFPSGLITTYHNNCFKSFDCIIASSSKHDDNKWTYVEALSYFSYDNVSVSVSFTLIVEINTNIFCLTN